MMRAEIELKQQTVRGNVHNAHTFVQEKEVEGEHQGCKVRGSITVDKVAGNIQFEYTGALQAEADTTTRSGQRLVLPPTDLR